MNDDDVLLMAPLLENAQRSKVAIAAVPGVVVILLLLQGEVGRPGVDVQPPEPHLHLHLAPQRHLLADPHNLRPPPGLVGHVHGGAAVAGAAPEHARLHVLAAVEAVEAALRRRPLRLALLLPEVLLRRERGLQTNYNSSYPE
jgi:hypothetical protein